MQPIDMDALSAKAPQVVRLLDAYWEALRAQDWNENTSLAMCADLAALVWARMLGFETAPAVAHDVKPPDA